MKLAFWRDSQNTCTSVSESAGSHRTSREEAAAALHRIGLSKSFTPPSTTISGPTFVVDISEQFEDKFASILAYKSQFSDQEAGKDLFPAQEEIRAGVDAMARFYGMLGGVTHAEPFLQKEVGLVDDLLAIPVKSI